MCNMDISQQLLRTPLFMRYFFQTPKRMSQHIYDFCNFIIFYTALFLHLWYNFYQERGEWKTNSSYKTTK